WQGGVADLDGIHPGSLQRQAAGTVQHRPQGDHNDRSRSGAVDSSTSTEAGAMIGRWTLSVPSFAKRGIWFSIVLIFGINSFTSLAQSLADIARKQRERQRTARSKFVVIGSGTTSAVTPPPADSAAAPAQPSAAKPAGVTDNKGRDEKYWRAAFQSARD